MKTSKNLLLLFLCLLAAIQSGLSQNLKQAISSSDGKTWELHEIVWIDGDEQESDEFGENEAYIENYDEATMIPETITFYSDGTCELLYIASYNETDGDADEDLVVEAYLVTGTWKTQGSNIKILEPAEEGEDDGGLDPEPGFCWWLMNVQVAEGEINCGFQYYGYTDGIQTLRFVEE